MTMSRRFIVMAVAAVMAATLCGPAAALTRDDLTRLSTQFRRHHDSHVIGPRIVGGTDATPGEFPFVVSLQTLSGFHFCGGSVLDATHVLTAAHCVVDGTTPSSLRAVVGQHLASAGGQAMAVSAINVHPEYNGGDNDIAVLTLAAAIDMSNPTDGYTPAAIARNTDAANEAAGTSSTVIGWGALSEGGSSPDVLQKVTVPMISLATCRSQYGSAVTDDFICAGEDTGGKDSCQGDSGGPLFVMVNGQPVQTGVVSWGEGCARPNRAGVYSNVRYFKSWIDSVVGDGGGGGGGGGGDDTALTCADGTCNVEVQITTDNYPAETSWELRDGSGAIVMEGGRTGASAALGAGVYSLTVFDSYGDGMCCSHGNGGWKLLVDGVEVRSGGEFADSESASITLVEPEDPEPPTDGTPVVLTGTLNGVTVKQTVYVTLPSTSGRRLRGGDPQK
jgi:trypsin